MTSEVQDVTSGGFTHSSNGKLIFIMSAFDVGSCSFDIWVSTKDLTLRTNKTYINNIHPRNSVKIYTLIIIVLTLRGTYLVNNLS